MGEIKKHLGGGFLKFDDFKTLLDKNPQILSIELSNWGEIFLNPQILDIMKYAHEHSIRLTARNGVNFNTVKEEVLEGLCKYKFYAITCSIDGATPETYSLYRREGDFNRVIANIERLNFYKKKYRTLFPDLGWQFVSFKHNQHEIQKAHDLAKSLGMRFFLKPSWDEDLSSGECEESIAVETLSEDILHQEACSQLWNIPQINWDGRVLGCCVNFWGDFGNAFKDDLEEVLTGSKISYARDMLLGKKEEREDIPCTSCVHYKQMKKTQRWLTPIEIFKLRVSLRYSNQNNLPNHSDREEI